MRRNVHLLKLNLIKKGVDKMTESICDRCSAIIDEDDICHCEICDRDALCCECLMTHKDAGECEADANNAACVSDREPPPT